MGDRAVYQRGSGWRAMATAGGLLLPLASNIPSARAEPGAVHEVQVVCPNLPEARTAELEARARATLLTSDLAATASISCVGEAVIVQVDADGDSVTLKVRVATVTLREDVLRALDRALADLGARGTRPTPEAQPTTPAPSAPGVVDAAPSLPATESPPPAVPRPGAPASAGASETEIAAEVIGESWGNEPALGGALRAAVRFDSTWSCGLRVGALHPPTFREATVIEAHALLEVTATASNVAGLRFGLGAGPSLLSVSPDSGFASSNATLKSALRIEAQVGRPFRFHHVELTPWIGARTFSAERGLRIADQPRLILGGVRPQFGVSLSFIH